MLFGINSFLEILFLFRVFMYPMENVWGMENVGRYCTSTQMWASEPKDQGNQVRTFGRRFTEMRALLS